MANTAPLTREALPAALTPPAQRSPSRVEKPAVQVAAFHALVDDSCQPDYEPRASVCVHAWYARVTPPERLTAEIGSYRSGTAAPMVGGPDVPLTPEEREALYEAQMRLAQEAAARLPQEREKLDPGALANGARSAGSKNAWKARASEGGKSLDELRAENADAAEEAEDRRRMMQAMNEHQAQSRKVRAVLERAKESGALDGRGNPTSAEARTQLERDLNKASPGLGRYRR